MAVPRPLDEQFADDYSQRASLRPSTGQISRTQNVRTQMRTDTARRQGARAARASMQTTGTALQTTGVAMQVTGKTAKVAGKSMNKAGQALTRTGLGAIVGVPLMAAGGVTQAAGTGVDAAGKATRKTGTSMKRSAKRMYTRGKIAMRKQPGKKADLKDRLKVSAVNTGIFSWGVPLWLVFQFPLAIVHLAVFGLALIEDQIVGTTKEITEVKETDDGVTQVVKHVFNWFGKAVTYVLGEINNAIADLTGIDIGAILASFLPSNIAALMTTVMFFYGMALLLAIGFIYLFSFIKPFTGEGATVKLSTFILCILGYSFPLFNLIPWFMFWCAAVWRYPK